MIKMSQSAREKLDSYRKNNILMNFKRIHSTDKTFGLLFAASYYLTVVYQSNFRVLVFVSCYLFIYFFAIFSVDK